MRIISQDGTIDIPYKIATILKRENTILARDDRAEFELAEYSTEAKAIKAMETLRKSYVNIPIVMQNVDISEDVAEEFERIKKCGIMVRTENQPSKVDFINNAVFQFPQDDEIGV